MKAASSGPSAWPKLPPTWNSDWARPWRPPEAMRATRDEFGWKIAEPMPTMQAAPVSCQNTLACDSSSRPTRVKAMPIASENGWRYLSERMPTKGWRIDAVAWKASVRMPIWPKSR